MKKRHVLCLLLCGLITLLCACAKPQKNGDAVPSVSVNTEIAGTDSADSALCDHAFGEWETVTEPKEGTEGLQRRICADCGAEETQPVAALPVHIHQYTETVFLADCTEDGFTQKVCVCGDSVKENVQTAPGHKYGEWQQISVPTYESEGERIRTCSACGNKEKQALAKIPKPPEPHVHNYTETVFAPTCTSDGYTLRACLCGDSSKTDVLSKLGHAYGEWSESLPPEGNFCGLERRDCETCGEVEMKTVPANLPTDPSAPPTPDLPPELGTDPENTETSGSSVGPDTEDTGTPEDNAPYYITYYSQRDERWGEKVLGCGIMKNNGCGPSAIAMAMNYYGIDVTPYDVALWLYENTIEFNHAFHGISGTGLKLGLEHYGRTVVPITTYEEFLEHLDAGAVVVGCQGQGSFVSRPENSHCVTMIGLNDGMVECYDPYTPAKNGEYSAESLWAERSRLEVDLRQEGITHYAVY